jgi:hypothetical protein
VARRLAPRALGPAGAGRSENPLFDLVRMTEALEVGYMLAWEQWLAGGGEARRSAHLLVDV